VQDPKRCRADTQGRCDKPRYMQLTHGVQLMASPCLARTVCYSLRCRAWAWAAFASILTVPQHGVCADSAIELRAHLEALLSLPNHDLGSNGIDADGPAALVPLKSLVSALTHAAPGSWRQCPRSMSVTACIFKTFAATLCRQLHGRLQLLWTCPTTTTTTNTFKLANPSNTPCSPMCAILSSPSH
jgi:hypothetical protein